MSIPMDLGDPDTTEGDTERGGLLSHPREWHALALGVLAGLSGKLPLIAALAAYVVGKNRPEEGWVEPEIVELAAREQAETTFGILVGLGFNLLVVGKIVPLV